MIVISGIQTECEHKTSRIEKLILLVAKGETDKIGELYDLIKTDVYAFALSKLANPSDAEDIMQNTFVQVFKYANYYKAQGKPMSWIFTIEINLIRRFCQLKKRTVVYEEYMDKPSESASVEDKVINSNFIKQMLKLLEEDERDIIVMHVISGLKHKEISKVLKKPLSTVLSRYNRAIKKLQRFAGGVN